jgi:hypothetical protein
MKTTKTYCDLCKREITPTNAALGVIKFKWAERFDAEMDTAPVGHGKITFSVENQADTLDPPDLCRHCLIDVVKKADDRVPVPGEVQ